ncbi:hypothetical protein BDQ17DRAFT_1327837 [Cyathus striatus]|nr:hypothetical protein BDQ17DRAFT_1327837 [Cyathus striatus]
MNHATPTLYPRQELLVGLDDNSPSTGSYGLMKGWDEKRSVTVTTVQLAFGLSLAVRFPLLLKGDTSYIQGRFLLSPTSALPLKARFSPHSLIPCIIIESYYTVPPVSPNSTEHAIAIETLYILYPTFLSVSLFLAPCTTCWRDGYRSWEVALIHRILDDTESNTERLRPPVVYCTGHSIAELWYTMKHKSLVDLYGGMEGRLEWEARKEHKENKSSQRESAKESAARMRWGVTHA